ncbi:SprT family zinc-dependent metalloprotease [uncultured Bartonella sp.]|uniref:M48 family metallopeptidase n=1 Tax=uncultured Bartonella sp. TaxID=104108 RepID=UPI002627739B|nr:SprT family zinc-dependent metalloprotease [uncultured Bartonella sp.]
MSQLTLELSDRLLPLTIVKSERAKRLTLRIEAGGKAVRVTVPPSTSQNQTMNFVERYRGWIEKRISHLPPPQDTPMLRVGVFIPILGHPYEIVHGKGRGTVEIVPDDDKKGGKIVVYGESEHIPRRLSDALKKQAALVIAPLIVKHSAIVGRKPASVRYKDTKSRWGSCSADGHLSFSWRIVMAPFGVINYLVAHETAHLAEMNHGTAFWSLCEKLCPNAKQYQAWLKRNGQALHAIEFK